MKQVIIDTNMLMAAAQFRVDIFSEISRICLFNYELCIAGKTVDELKNIYRNQRGRHKAAAKMALALLRAHKLREIAADKISGSVDDIILEIACREKHIVATQDIALKKRLKEKGIPLITLRQKKHLVFP